MRKVQRHIWSGWGGGGLSVQRVVGPGETTWGGGQRCRRGAGMVWLPGRRRQGPGHHTRNTRATVRKQEIHPVVPSLIPSTDS